MKLFKELRLDLDFSKQKICNIGIRLLKIFQILEEIAIDYFIFLTRNGIHIRALVTPDVSDDVLLIVRGYLHDDYTRLSLDWVRLRKKTIVYDILFNWRIKFGLTGCEKFLPLEQLPKLLQVLDEICYEYCMSVKKKKSMRRLLKVFARKGF